MTTNELFAAIMLRIRRIRPIYGTIYSMLRKREVTGIKTMGVSTTEIVYNDEFIQNTPLEELIFINLHEIMHFALMHSLRLENRNPEVFNIACDLYVNKFLMTEFNLNLGMKKNINGVDIKVPLSALYDESIDINKDSVEIIYDRLMKNNQKSNDYDGDVIFSTDSKVAIEKDKVKSMLLQVITKEKLCGNMSGNLIREIERVVYEKVHWEKIVSKYLIEDSQKETSYRTIDYRMHYQEAIFPGNLSYDSSKLDRVKICVDTSASISDSDLSQFADSIIQLLKKYKVGAELIYWDTECQSSGFIKDEISFNRVECRGNGGTTPNCLFEYFDSKKCKVKPSLVIVLTDGIFNTDSLQKYSRKYKNTIWILSKNHCDFDKPFGTVGELR